MGTDESFRSLVSDLDYPMFIVTAAAGEERSGCLVGFTTQASIEPPRLLVMISKANHTYRVALAATTLVAHFLGYDNQGLARLFGEETGDGIDKFAGCDWREGPDHTPVLLGTRGWVSGPIVSRLDAGDHVAHVIDVTHAAADVRARQLSFQAVRDMRPGHPAT